MKKLLIVLAALMIPTVVFGANVAPKLYLEVYTTADDPSDPLTPPPAEACVHSQPVTYPWTLPCYSTWVRYNYYIVPVHVGSLDTPTCPDIPPGAPQCNTYGGYLGMGFGVASTGTGTLGYMNFIACPGFLKGPSVSGEPSSILASSTVSCHGWTDHEGYLIYFASGSATGAARHLDIVASADLGHVKVINCVNQYDNGTTVGGGVQIGGAQTEICGNSPTPVTATTWGAIKGLYR